MHFIYILLMSRIILEGEHRKSIFLFIVCRVELFGEDQQHRNSCNKLGAFETFLTFELDIDFLFFWVEIRWWLWINPWCNENVEIAGWNRCTFFLVSQLRILTISLHKALLSCLHIKLLWARRLLGRICAWIVPAVHMPVYPFLAKHKIYFVLVYNYFRWLNRD